VEQGQKHIAGPYLVVVFVLLAAVVVGGIVVLPFKQLDTDATFLVNLVQFADKVAEGIAAGNLKGKLCNIVCQLQTRKWEREGRCGISTTIKVVSIKGLFDTMDEYLDEEKKNDANSTNQQ
jgi:single-stranded DNA-binding protein